MKTPKTVTCISAKTKRTTIMIIRKEMSWSMAAVMVKTSRRKPGMTVPGAGEEARDN